jgi:heme/copper-type cytochrome/quinol oxidase subunit 2
MTPSPMLQTSYVSAHPRGRIAIILLVIGAACSALIIVAEIGQILFPEFNQSDGVADNPGGLVALLLYAALTILGFFVFVVTAIFFLMWLHRSSNNLTAFGHWRSQGYSPAWTVGSFFVPIVNLFVPYQATKYVWQKSHPATSEPFSFSNSPPGFFAAWWGFWLASNFATNIHFRMSGGEVPHTATAIVGIVSEVLSIAAAGFAIQVIKEIDRRQEETIQHVIPTGHLPVPPPPPVFDSHGEQLLNTRPHRAGPPTVEFRGSQKENVLLVLFRKKDAQSLSSCTISPTHDPSDLLPAGAYVNSARSQIGLNHLRRGALAAATNFVRSSGLDLSDLSYFRNTLSGMRDDSRNAVSFPW